MISQPKNWLKILQKIPYFSYNQNIIFLKLVPVVDILSIGLILSPPLLDLKFQRVFFKLITIFFNYENIQNGYRLRGDNVVGVHFM